MEIRQRNVIFNKSGGNASKSSFSTKMSIPIIWVKEMGIDEENRGVTISFDGKRIIIEKCKEDFK